MYLGKCAFSQVHYSLITNQFSVLSQTRHHYEQMSLSTRFLVAILIVLLVSPAEAKTNLDSKNPDHFVCDTSADRSAAELALDRYHRLRRPAALSSTIDAATVDQGNIAVLQDDGTVITPPNRLDLANNTVTFTPAGDGSYSVVTQAVSFDNGAGGSTPVTLGDDDTSQSPAPATTLGLSPGVSQV